MVKPFDGDVYTGLRTLETNRMRYFTDPANKANPDKNQDNNIDARELRDWYNNYYVDAYTKEHPDYKPKLTPISLDEANTFLELAERAAKEKALEEPDWITSKTGVEQDRVLKSNEIQLALAEYEDADTTGGN